MHVEIHWTSIYYILGGCEVTIYIVGRFLFSFLHALDDATTRLSLSSWTLFASLCLVNIDFVISFLS